MRNTPIPSGLFIRNRAKIRKQLEASSLVVLKAAEPVIRNGDVHYPFRQDSDFFYFSGIQVPGATLALDRSGEVLFLPSTNEKARLWNGPGLSLEEAQGLSGIRDVRRDQGLDEFMREQLGRRGLVYTQVNSHQPDFWRSYRMAFPEVEIRSVEPLSTPLRMLKEAEELDEIRRACQVTARGFREALGVLAPGIWEFEMVAALTASFLRQGSVGHAFEPIVASGKNALILHYVQNNAVCREGELVLMDFGAEMNNYAGDCSRTLPVSGRFTSRQRQLYEATHRVFLQARDLMVPGTLLDDFHRQVGAIWAEEHIRLGLYSAAEARSAPKDRPLWKKYYMHGTSHSMGLDVHDPFLRSTPFAPGMVLSCEPGIYIPEEGVGIRLENDILISDEGPVDLLEDIPMEAREMEALMQEKHPQ
jgi:Xaa-Pro aminopeptidase